MMDEAKIKALTAQMEKIYDEMDTLMELIRDNDAEKQRISMLVSGTPDLHVRNPSLYEKQALYADENKPPFTTESWQILGMTGKDPRLTFAQIEEFKKKQEEGNPFAWMPK